MNVIRQMGRTVGIDADDLKVVAAALIVVLVLGLLLVVLAFAAGIAVAAFDVAASL